MLDGVLDAVVAALSAEGLNVIREFPERMIDLASEASIAVGIESCKDLSAGMGEYLGLHTSEDGGTDAELFGKRLELELRFEIFSPYGVSFGASGCARCADSLRKCFGKLPSGLKILSMGD